MKIFDGYMRGTGLGGWLTNFKRLRFIPVDQSTIITTGDREHFETYITESDVKQIASWGCDHIRLAFDYVLLEDENNPLVLRRDDLGFKYLDRFINWAKKYNLNVVLDLHRAAGSSCEYADDASLMDNEKLLERFVWIWQEIAKHYKDTDGLAFELLNEVHAPDPATWNTVYKRAVEAIRKIDAQRPIVIGSNNYGTPPTFNDLEVLDDDNIIYSFHSYHPFEFTHQRAVIAPILAVYNRYMKYPSEIEPYLDFRKFAKWDDSEYRSAGRIDRKLLEQNFQPVFDFQNKYDKPVYCGEFGVIRHCDIKSRENYYRDVIGICKDHNIAYSAWNYLTAPYDANRFSIVDDWNRKPLSQELIKIISGK